MDSSPEGGGIDGIWVGRVPGGSKDTDVIVGLMKPGGSDGIDVIVVARMPGASAIVVGMDGVVAGKKLGGISEAIPCREKLRLEKGEHSEQWFDRGRYRPPLIAIECLGENNLFPLIRKRE